MTARAFLLSLVLLLPLAARAGDLRDMLLAADAERIQAMLKGNTEALARVLADDLTYGHTTGAVDNKAQLLGKLKRGDLIYQSIQTHDLVARPYGTAGVVTGTALLKVLNAHKPVSVSMRFTATYARLEGRWQLVAYQSTSLPDGPPLQ